MADINDKFVVKEDLKKLYDFKDDFKNVITPQAKGEVIFNNKASDDVDSDDFEEKLKEIIDHGVDTLENIEKGTTENIEKSTIENNKEKSNKKNGTSEGDGIDESPKQGDYSQQLTDVIRAEINNEINEEIEKAKQQLIEEQKKIIAQVVEEQKSLIQKTVDEEKKVMWDKIANIRESLTQSLKG